MNDIHIYSERLKYITDRAEITKLDTYYKITYQINEKKPLLTDDLDYCSFYIEKDIYINYNINIITQRYIDYKGQCVDTPIWSLDNKKITGDYSSRKTNETETQQFEFLFEAMVSNIAYGNKDINVVAISNKKMYEINDLGLKIVSDYINQKDYLQHGVLRVDFKTRIVPNSVFNSVFNSMLNSMLNNNYKKLDNSYNIPL